MPFAYLTPYSPGTDGPWDAVPAAHLLRRAGFGASPDEVARAVEQGLDAAVDSLFDGAAAQEAEFHQVFGSVNNGLLDFNDIYNLEAWWCFRMRQSRTPLVEKLTLFWHGHFATSYYKVGDPYLLHLQNETLRKHAWGNFRDLVLAMARDPAMLVYLDGETNTKEQPNENFARELMELFTVGIGNYTEKDVRAAARAFSGWHRNGYEFLFNAEAHDDGEKTFLKQKGPLDGGDIIDILLKQSACATFIARKLLVFFACPEPSPAVVTEAAEVFRRSRLNVRRLLSELFRSQFFYSKACRRTRISSPAEYVIGTCRTLGVRSPGTFLRDNMIALEQELFAPPNVKGWDGEKKWINSSTWAARLSAAEQFGIMENYSPFGSLLEVSRVVPADLADPARVVDLLVALLLDGELSAERRGELAKSLTTADDADVSEQFRDDAAFRANRIRELIGVMMSLPEYHAY